MKMRKLISILFLFMMGCLFLVGCRSNDSNFTTNSKFIKERIENYTKIQFKSTKDVNVKFDNSEFKLYVSFVPEVGSYPIKSEIYKSIANHAMNVKVFFPEASEYEYLVFWADSTKEAMTCIIDKEAVKNMTANYYSNYDKNKGETINYTSFFSKIIETEESKTWRN